MFQGAVDLFGVQTLKGARRGVLTIATIEAKCMVRQHLCVDRLLTKVQPGEYDGYCHNDQKP